MLESIIAAVAAEPNERFTPDRYDIFPWGVEPCFSGNDNMLVDSYFNVPTPMLDCWPGKFYHSNLDTPDKLSAGSLARCIMIGAAYLYLLVTAGPEEARWMANLTQRGWKHRILNGAPAWQGVDALKSILHLEPTLADDIAAMVGDLTAFSELEAPPADCVISQTIDSTEEWQSIPLKPTHWKPPTPEQFSPEGQARLAASRQECPKIEEAWWLQNGRRNAHELCARAHFPAEGVVAYLRLLLQEGLNLLRMMPPNSKPKITILVQNLKTGVFSMAYEVRIHREYNPCRHRVCDLLYRRDARLRGCRSSHLIGGTNALLGLVTREGSILAREKFLVSTELEPGDLVDELAARMRGLAQQCQLDWRRVRGIGYSTAGMMDVESGIIFASPNQSSWRDVAFRD